MRKQKRLTPKVVISFLALIFLIAVGAFWLWSSRGFCGVNPPILFYGRVLDQNEQPLEATTVHAQVTATNLFLALGVPALLNPVQKDLKIKTDHDGQFAIHGVCGDWLRIGDISKQGYLNDPYLNDHVFGFDPVKPPLYEPNLDSPETFYLWRPGPGDDIVMSDEWTWNLFAPYNRWYTVDLLEHKASTTTIEGDFRLRVDAKAKDNPLSFRSPPPSSLIIQAIDGGAQETNDPYLWRAPEIGYQPEIEIAPTENVNSAKKFYLRSRHGQVYGGLTVSWEDYGNKVLIELKYRANPHGSVVLEPVRSQ